MNHPNIYQLFLKTQFRKQLKTSIKVKNNKHMNQNSSLSSFQGQYYDPCLQLKSEILKKKKMFHNPFQIMQIPSNTYFNINSNFHRVQAVKAKRHKRGKLQYLIEWQGYEGQDTWQTTENLQHIKGMIQDFQKREKLIQIQKQASKLRLWHQYSHDFSYLGKNLVIIDAEITQNSERNRKDTSEYSTNSYESSVNLLSNSYTSSYKQSAGRQKSMSIEPIISEQNWEIDQNLLYEHSKQSKSTLPQSTINPITFKPRAENSKGKIFPTTPTKKITVNDLIDSDDDEQVPIRRQVIIRPYIKSNKNSPSLSS